MTWVHKCSKINFGWPSFPTNIFLWSKEGESCGEKDPKSSKIHHHHHIPGAQQCLVSERQIARFSDPDPDGGLAKNSILFTRSSSAENPGLAFTEWNDCWLGGVWIWTAGGLGYTGWRGQVEWIGNKERDI